MVKAAEPPHQRERLAALRSFEILDTDPEQAFDEIVKLAAATCGTAISVVNFIDADRQWFKAEVGLGVRQTPLATSLCAHAILEEDFVEIHDTLKDPRMQDNPLCLGQPGLRFYAGSLLRTDDGLPLGTLCVLDHQPSALTPLQRDTLRVLSRQVMALLEARKAIRIAEVLRQEVDHRVKNSLQSLSSFIRLQQRAFESPEAKLALTTVKTRIDALAQLHEQLYKTDQHLSVDLGAFIPKICAQLAQFAPGGVALRCDAVPVNVSTQQAAAVGTYLNEFIANSFKHAFPDGKTGVVEISLRQSTNDEVELLCRDDGVGLPDSLTAERAGLGMKIARVVCMELDTNLVLRNGETGVVASLRFLPRPT